MTCIGKEQQYQSARQRIEELLKLVSNDTPKNDVNSAELELLSNLVADYEDEHYPIRKPTLQQARMMSRELNISPLIVLGM